MWDKILNYIQRTWYYPLVLCGFLSIINMGLVLMPPKKTEQLKEYKDGIQNHLIWNIKGECFFVRPNDDITVHLIRVQDCDKK